MYTEQLTQALSLADEIVPANAASNNTAYASGAAGGIDMAKFKRAMYEIQIGAITGAGTLDARLQSSPTNTFSTVHNIANSNITQITNANPNTRVTVEVRADQVESLNPGDRYVRLSVNIGSNSVVFGATGWGGDAEHDPVNANDITAAIQRLVVAP